MVRRLFLAAVLIASALALVAAAPAQARPRVGTTSLPPKHPSKLTAQATVGKAAFPYTDTFKLHSLPGASRVIHLDFDGDTISGTAWNNEFNGGSSFAAPAYDIDGNTASFSTAEHDLIQAAWQRVAEDFAPFNVDVTTEDPGTAAIDRAGSGDAFYGTRALITNTDTIYSSCGCAGVGYIGVFGVSYQHQYYQPALIFGKAIGGYDKDLGDVISHEVGHNLGLEHDGKGAESYYVGHGAWAPIMGAGYYRPITQWGKGEYTDATNTEDDFVVMQNNGLPLRADDVGDTTASPTLFSATGTAKGVISTDADVDVYSYVSAGGSPTFTATPAAKGPNLDIKLQLLNASGTVIASADPASGATNYDTPTGLSASVAAATTAGQTYYVRVEGVGSGDAATTGYSGYGSVGQYTLTGPSVAVVVPSISVADRVVNEGTTGTTTPMNFTLSLSVAAPAPITLALATSNGTGAAGSDYTARTATITIPAGATSATFGVNVTGDTVPEPHETLSLTLSNPVGATIGDGLAVGTIVNDDGIGIVVNDVSISEGVAGTTRTLTFTLTLSTAPTTTIGVTAKTVNGTAQATYDYNALTQALYFSAGQRTKTFTVTIKGDSVKEANETFYVSLSAPTGTGAKITDGTGIGTIVNDDL